MSYADLTAESIKGGFAAPRKRERRSSFRPPAIHTPALPQALNLQGLEFVSYVRPVDSFAGDFFDVCCHNGEDTWMFLGDVTGHGTRAGMVKLMAQSILTALVKVRPGISPSELNFLANKELCATLGRLGVQRHISVVSICRRGDGRFLVSGSHDSMFVVRAATGTVEEVELTHFPFGLGFLSHLRMCDFAECEVVLGPQDILYIGTDGVTEAAPNGDYAKGIFGEEALKSFLCTIGDECLDEVRAELVDRLDAFTDGCYGDDLTFVMIRQLAAD